MVLVEFMETTTGGKSVQKTARKILRRITILAMNIDAIILNNDLLAMAERDGAIFKKHQTGWHSACPIHRGDNKTAFSVWVEDGKQKWHCFTKGCGGGDIIDYVMARDRVDLKRACEILGGGTPMTQEEVIKAAEERRVRAEAYEEKKRAEYKQALEELWAAKAWERYYQNLEVSQAARKLWRDRGIPDDWQNLWKLGYCPEFTYFTDTGKNVSPSLTIPIFTEDYTPANIRHRILNPFNPNDKYRPDRPGLKALPFIADFQSSEHECNLIVEGEVKAMVSYIWLDSEKWQVYGIPGKENYRELCERLKGRRVWVLFDPDATEQAQDAARIIGKARIVNIQMKIDDALNGGYIDTGELRRLLRMAKVGI